MLSLDMMRTIMRLGQLAYAEWPTLCARASPHYYMLYARHVQRGHAHHVVAVPMISTESCRRCRWCENAGVEVAGGVGGALGVDQGGGRVAERLLVRLADGCELVAVRKPMSESLSRSAVFC